MIELDTTNRDGARIKVIGVGGGGGNAVNNMITRGLTGVDFISANTDKQALDHNLANIKIHVGREITRGLGAGSNPSVGSESVEENSDDIREALKGSDMVFVTCGMGGGTGTGGSPVVAKIAKELGSLVVGIVTKPFMWEGKKRITVAETGIESLRKHVDALIIIPNQKLLEIIDKNTNFGEAFLKVDEVLYNATRGIADIICQHGVVNVDFADVKTVMEGMGDAIMGIGTASGEDRAKIATFNALNSPLLDGVSIEGAQGVLVNITGGSDMTMMEVAEAVSIVEESAGSDANLIHGVVYKNEPTDELSVTVVATGFNKTIEMQQEAAVEQTAINDPIEIFPTPAVPVNRTAAKPPFNPLGGGFGKPAPGPTIKKEVPTFTSSRPESSPRGSDELKKYDVPAYERRPSQEAMPQIANEVSKLETFPEPSHIQQAAQPTAPSLSQTSLSQNRPAFLRKILD
jgi:cell division protein FtsZ